MKKGYSTVAVDPITQMRITEMANYDNLPKSVIVENAVAYYMIKWSEY
jgi:hypothetical protein